jgi:hypothetical protein
MYRSTDHHLAAAERAEDEAAAAAERREAFVAGREAEISTMLATRPLLACVPAMHGNERGAIPVAADMAGWIGENFAELERTLAECMFSSDKRARIAKRYALARAQAECDRLPASYFDEAAS